MTEIDIENFASSSKATIIFIGNLLAIEFYSSSTGVGFNFTNIIISLRGKR